MVSRGAEEIGLLGCCNRVQHDVAYLDTSSCKFQPGRGARERVRARLVVIRECEEPSRTVRLGLWLSGFMTGAKTALRPVSVAARRLSQTYASSPVAVLGNVL